MYGAARVHKHMDVALVLAEMNTTFVQGKVDYFPLVRHVSRFLLFVGLIFGRKSLRLMTGSLRK